MRDIVDRLREAQRVETSDGTGRSGAALCVDMKEAADEIEQLRFRVNLLLAEIKLFKE